MADHELFLRRSLELARDTMDAGRGGPFGALVVQGEHVVAEGQNEVLATNDPTAHAEITAIRRAARSLGSPWLSGCVLYTSCEPCPMCLGAIYWARLEAVWYVASRQDAARAGFVDRLIYDEVLLEPSARRIPFRRLSPRDAPQPLTEWKHKPDRRAY